MNQSCKTQTAQHCPSCSYRERCSLAYGRFSVCPKISPLVQQNDDKLKVSDESLDRLFTLVKN